MNIYNIKSAGNSLEKQKNPEKLPENGVCGVQKIQFFLPPAFNRKEIHSAEFTGNNIYKFQTICIYFSSEKN